MEARKPQTVQKYTYLHLNEVDCGLNSTTLPGPSPLGHLAPLGLLHADDLVAVEQAERVEGGFDLDNVEKIK
jgi:hypothetical protein